MTDRLRILDHCPVCLCKERTKLHALDLYAVYKCSKCFLRYIDPCLSSEGMRELYSSTENLTALNEFHSTYYAYSDPHGPSRTVKDFEKALKLLEGADRKSGKSVFDVGCGNGLFLAVAQKRGWRVHGCDSAEKNVAFAREKFGVDVDCSNFDQWGAKGRQYDVVAFWDVLEHLTDPHVFVEKAAEILRPGGRIVAAGPNDKSLFRMAAEMLFLCTGGRVRGPLQKAYLLEHVTYYTLETMKTLFAQHGFALQYDFATSTDLEKYHFMPLEKIAASLVLGFGKVLGLQNRFVAIFQSGDVSK